MEQYIKKSALIAEIERLEKINQEYKKAWKWKFKWFYRTIIGRLEVLEGLKEFINTLEVKEVDLDKEIKKYSMELAMKENNGDWLKDITATAKHFFELGLKAAQKGEEYEI